ncbi:MAG: phosphatase PAP2 family protein [Haloarculaceae archaeon]
MQRRLGIGALLRDALAPVAPAVALLTQLGDTWFLLGLVLTAYLFGPTLPRLGLDRRDGARLVAIALGAFAVTHTAKDLVAAPRPAPAPAPAYLPAVLEAGYEWLVHTSSGGFPSGHAVGATAVWGGLAVLATWPDRGRRYALAGTLVVLLAASRLALGLHVAVDVVAGVAIGLVVLVVLVRLPTPGHALAAVSGAAAVGFAVVFDGEAAAIFGAAVATTLVWLSLGESLTRADPGVRQVLAAALPLGMTTAAAAVLVERTDPPTAAIGLASAVAGVVVLAVPLLVERTGRMALVQYFSR